jgi:hypothetical protein
MVEMLHAVQDGWSSYNFTVFDRSGMPVARAELSKWRETAKLEVAGGRFEAHSKGRTRKEFVLEKDDGQVVTGIEKPSIWRNRFVFEYGYNCYEIRKESAWGNAFVLYRNGVGLVGSIRSKGLFKREWIVDLPEELPLEVKVFIVWLMAILWKRSVSSAAGAGAAVGAGG